MAYAYNFSKAKNRTSKLYGFADINFSSTGLDVKLVLMWCILTALSFIICVIIGSVIGDMFINPFQEDGMDFSGVLYAVLIPSLITGGLWGIKIQHYRLYQFLYLYFLPRKTVNIAGKVPTQDKVIVDAFVWK